MYNPVRGGTRGGKDQFSWEEIRLLSFKERECYLGSTTKMGYLDRGGRWRQRDWWTKTGNGKGGNAASDELRRVQEEDERRMRQALGLEVKDVDNKPHLSQYEIQELTRKERVDAPPMEEDERLPGLGFDPTTFKAKPVTMDQVYDNTDYNKLDGEGIRPDEKKTDRKVNREAYASGNNRSADARGVLEDSKKIKKEKKEKKKEKKEKKDKKEKKHKKKEKKHKEHRRRDSSSSRSRSRSESKERSRRRDDSRDRSRKR